jgi:hypothetical protein
MQKRQMDSDRRRFLQTGALLAGGSILPAWATDLVPTPAQMRGPFFPLTFPLDQDNNLASVSGRSGIAYGMITNIAGQVLNDKGRPQAGIRVEIWQVNGYGRYHHAGDDSDFLLAGIRDPRARANLIVALAPHLQPPANWPENSISSGG